MFHDSLEHRKDIIMPNVKKYTFADVKSSLNTVGAVAPVPTRPTYTDIGLAVRVLMRLEDTNVVCAHTSLYTVVAVSPQALNERFFTCTRSLAAPHSPVMSCIWCSYTPYNSSFIFISVFSIR